MARRRSAEDAPPGGWLGPPDTTGLAALKVANGSQGGKWKWKENKLTDKQKEKHAKFQKKMKKADDRGEWRW